jgi:hypothetical protein
LLFGNVFSKEVGSLQLNAEQDGMPVGLFVSVEDIGSFNVKLKVRAPRKGGIFNFDLSFVVAAQVLYDLNRLNIVK